jgi:hypothetical protein
MLTFSTGVGLHEFPLGTCFCEFGRQAGQLGEDFVNQTQFGGKVIPMDVQGQKTTNVACKVRR